MENYHEINQLTFNSSRVNPRPALIFMLYFNVCPRTIGRRGPAVGLGKIFTAFAWRAGTITEIINQIHSAGYQIQ